MCAQAVATQPPRGAQGWGHLRGPPRERGRGGVFPLTGVPGLRQVLKGKLHGAIDVRQSVMSVNKKAQRVDLDTEDNIYHLKVPLGGTGAGMRQGWGHQVVSVPRPQLTPVPPDQVPGAVLQLGEQPLQPPPRRAAGAVSPGGSHGDQRAGG